ncbi:TetR/AcrR family transcriptional regulator [Demequina sediminicola]|uniref:TetR/AcrR family transcriptional regulator n=1 Tax=Demequina sediminicola TaxID=1095026 RepID=UPI000781687E|nr:TetR family transcriptional regulator [Demequina sediminicola]
MTETDARERILDAALSLFAERSADAVSLRDIAAAADVSVALIPHYFTNKTGLVDAVNARIIGIFDGARDAMASADGVSAAIAEHFPSDSPTIGYLRRCLTDGSDTGRVIFQRWYGMTVELLGDLERSGAVTPTADPQARAAFLMANDLAIILLRDHLAESLGTDPLSTEGLTRWTAEALTAYTHGVFTQRDATSDATSTKEQQ